ncbi:TrkA family potassium uptake protein [bacterium]|nr:TrkA family potassium uptake protein [bacterium]
MRQIAIIGLGTFGFKLATSLTEMGCQVLAVDNDRDRVQEIRDLVADAVVLDARDKSAMDSLDLVDLDMVVVCVGQLEASVLISLYLKEAGVGEIVVKALSADHVKILELLGASRTILPEEAMAERLAGSLMTPNIIDHIPLTPGHSIVEVKAPEKFWGKTIAQLDVRKNYKVEVIAVKKYVISKLDGKESLDESKTRVIPAAGEVINSGDALVVIGRNKDIEKIRGL